MPHSVPLHVVVAEAFIPATGRAIQGDAWRKIVLVMVVMPVVDGGPTMATHSVNPCGHCGLQVQLYCRMWLLRPGLYWDNHP